MAYVKTYLPTLKTLVVNLKRDAKDLSRELQRLEVRGKLGSKTLQWTKTWSAILPFVLSTKRDYREISAKAVSAKRKLKNNRPSSLEKS